MADLDEALYLVANNFRASKTKVEHRMSFTVFAR